MIYPPAIICTIETPQFRPDGTIEKFQRQTGYFYADTLMFVVAMKEFYGGHDVRFPSIENFEKHCISSSL